MKTLKKLMLAFGIAAIVVSAQAAVFSSQQTITVEGNGLANLSDLYWYDFNTGSGAFMGAQFGTYDVQYPMPSGSLTWMGLYDYDQGRWTEGTYLLDQAI